MPQQTSYTVFKTEAGWVGIEGTTEGIKQTTLPQPSEKQVLSQLGINANRATLSTKYHMDLIQRFRDYFSGKRVNFQDAPDLRKATAFQRSVWKTARKIPYGETRSYGWIARHIGKPKAARAVGQALGKNPLPIIIPCHRVLNSDGTLGGFTGGLKMKRRLLTLEKRAGRK